MKAYFEAAFPWERKHLKSHAALLARAGGKPESSLSLEIFEQKLS